MKGRRTCSESSETPRIVALAGNPNVGKSTLFNALTGLHQHTGNWTGKTVGCTEGICKKSRSPMTLVDLPGTYSLTDHSEEERVARDYICSDEADLVAVVCDATCLERNLILVLQILCSCDRVIVCVNLMDEAKKRGIRVDLSCLEQELGVPVVGLSAGRKKGIEETVHLMESASRSPTALCPEGDATALAELAHMVAERAVSCEGEAIDRRDRRIDRVLTGRLWGFPLMLLMLTGIFWLTVEGANLPSAWLSTAFFWLEDYLLLGLEWLGAPPSLSGALILGVYRTVAWVVSVMLPPMAIFFPLFTILEDLGVLPRVAFNLDRCFQKCNACGKQALTM